MEQNTNHNSSKGLIADLFNQRIQLELLFSTGAIVSLSNMSSWLLIPTKVMTERLGVGGYIFTQMSFTFISAAISALIIGFSLNILFRVLTLCYLGIDYVFPEGIKKEKLGYNDHIEPKINNNIDSSKWINYCEKLSGFSFSISIILVLKLLGLGILFSSLIFIMKLTGFDPFTLENNKKYANFLDSTLPLSIAIILGLLDYILHYFCKRCEIGIGFRKKLYFCKKIAFYENKKPSFRKFSWF